MDEEAWRRRIEHKIDRLAHAVTCLALATRTPLLPALPPRRRRSALWPIIFRLLASYLLPALGTLLLLARHALGRLWEALLAAFASCRLEGHDECPVPQGPRHENTSRD